MSTFLFSCNVSHVSAPLVGAAVRLVSSKEREREGEEEARRQLEEEERNLRQEEEKKKVDKEEGEGEEEEEGKKRKCEEDEGEEGEEEGRSLGSESYTTAASSLSYNVCKICHCGGEVIIIMLLVIVNQLF